MAEGAPGFTEVAEGPVGAPGFREIPPPDTDSPFVGALKDTFGLTNRPGKRTVLDVLAKPEGALEHAALLAVMAPTIALGGAGAGAAAARAGIPLLTKLAPLAGRLATSGALGAGKAEARGDDPLWGALIDAAVGAAGEGWASALRGFRLPLPSTWKGSLADLGAAVRGYEGGTAGGRAAFEEVASRLPRVSLVIPSLGPNKITFQEAINKLYGIGRDKGLHNNDYIIARGELIDAMNRAEQYFVKASGSARPLGPRAGSLFGKLSKDARFPPSGSAKFFEGTRRALGNDPKATSAVPNVVRSGIEAAGEEPIEGLPAAAWAGGLLDSATGGGLSSIARRVMR